MGLKRQVEAMSAGLKSLRKENEGLIFALVRWRSSAALKFNCFENENLKLVALEAGFSEVNKNIENYANGLKRVAGKLDAIYENKNEGMDDEVKGDSKNPANVSLDSDTEEVISSVNNWKKNLHKVKKPILTLKMVKFALQEEETSDDKISIPQNPKETVTEGEISECDDDQEEGMIEVTH